MCSDDCYVHVFAHPSHHRISLISHIVYFNDLGTLFTPRWPETALQTVLSDVATCPLTHWDASRSPTMYGTIKILATQTCSVTRCTQSRKTCTFTHIHSVSSIQYHQLSLVVMCGLYRTRQSVRVPVMHDTALTSSSSQPSNSPVSKQSPADSALRCFTQSYNPQD